MPPSLPRPTILATNCIPEIKALHCEAAEQAPQRSVDPRHAQTVSITPAKVRADLRRSLDVLRRRDEQLKIIFSNRAHAIVTVPDRGGRGAQSAYGVTPGAEAGERRCRRQCVLIAGLGRGGPCGLPELRHIFGTATRRPCQTTPDSAGPSEDRPLTVSPLVRGRSGWCGGSRIRTLEGVSRRIYSPLPYAFPQVIARCMNKC
jgi:hypothetical protein